MFNWQRLRHSLRYARQGLRYIWQHEQNFRIQVSFAGLVLLAMVILRVQIWQAIVLGMLIMFVLVLEIANTIFETLIDFLKPRLHSYVQVIKDMMAAAVLLAAVGSAIIGLMIFVPYLVNML